MLTGRHLWQNEEAGNHLAYFPQKLKSWPEALTEQGWHTGITGQSWGPGIANDSTGKPRLITGKPFNQRKASDALPTRQAPQSQKAKVNITYLDKSTGIWSVTCAEVTHSTQITNTNTDGWKLKSRPFPCLNDIFLNHRSGNDTFVT